MDSHQGGMVQGQEIMTSRVFSESGSSLVHHYRVFGHNAAHASLRGRFMAGLRRFIEHAEAEARCEFNRLPNRRNQLPVTSHTARRIRPRDPDNESPLCKTRRVVSPVIPEVSADTSSSMIASSVKSSAGPAASYVPPAPRPRSGHL